MRRRRVLKLRLAGQTYARAEADAARRGLELRAWAVQTLEAHLAGCECSHAGRPAEPAPPAEADEDGDG